MSTKFIRIPGESFQTAVGKLLSAYQTVPVYDSVPKGAKLPYIVLDELIARPGGSKDHAVYDVSLNIVVYSTYHGKKEVNNIINDIATIVSGAWIDMSADKFQIMNQWVEACDMFPGGPEGYRGIVTFKAEIEEMGE